MNVILKMWKKSWVAACKIPHQRTLLKAQAWNWSNKVRTFLRMME